MMEHKNFLLTSSTEIDFKSNCTQTKETMQALDRRGKQNRKQKTARGRQRQVDFLEFKAGLYIASIRASMATLRGPILKTGDGSTSYRKMTRVASAFTLSIITCPHTKDKCPSITSFKTGSARWDRCPRGESVKQQSEESQKALSSLIHHQGRFPPRGALSLPSASETV